MWPAANQSLVPCVTGILLCLPVCRGNSANMVQYWRLQAEQGAEAGSHQPVHSARGMLLPSVTLTV